MANMGDRSSNGDYKYQREEDVDPKSRLEKEEEDEKEHQVDKAGEYVRELLQEKVELDTQKWPNAIRLIDQGKRLDEGGTISLCELFFAAALSFGTACAPFFAKIDAATHSDE